MNQTVLDAYASAAAPKERSVSSVGEYDPALFTGSVTDSFASYGDVAFVTLSRFATEGNDLAMVNDEGKRMLELDDNEKAIFQKIKDSGKFKKTVVLLNSVFAMEMDWLDEYNVDAVLWVGNPGFYGMPGAIRVVTGEVNLRSHHRHLCRQLLSAPSAENFGLHAYNYGSKTPRAAGDSFVSYNEGIYVGYRYYETRYEDTILGQGNADSTVGTKASTDGWNYAEEVCFPFGYGLSYTNYEYNLDKLDYNSDTDTFTATVTVSNTGDRDGKATVELYAQTPTPTTTSRTTSKSPRSSCWAMTKSTWPQVHPRLSRSMCPATSSRPMTPTAQRATSSMRAITTSPSATAHTRH